MPHVSVIMPAHNSANTLIHAAQSVLDQSHSDLELIIVDDASSDSSQDIIRSLQQCDSRVRYIQRTENSRSSQFPSEPRNDALNISQGEFIAYLDSDNVWCKNFLMRMLLQFANNKSCILAYCNSKNYYSRDQKCSVISQDQRELVAHGYDWTVFRTQNLKLDTLGISQYVDTNEIVHRASILKQWNPLWSIEHPRRINILKSQNYIRPHRRFNDLELVERILRHFGVSSIIHVDEVLVHFFYPTAIKNRSDICKCNVKIEREVTTKKMREYLG